MQKLASVASNSALICTAVCYNGNQRYGNNNNKDSTSSVLTLLYASSVQMKLIAFGHMYVD